MYPVSQAYLNAINEGEAKTIAGSIRLKDGTIYTITNENIQLTSLNLNRKCVDKAEFALGSVYAAELNIAVITADNHARFNDGVIDLRFGIATSPTQIEYVPLGIYNIVECKRAGRCVSIKALDNMIKLDKPEIKYNAKTASLYEFTTYACGLSGVTLGMSQSAFMRLPNANQTLELLSNSPVVTPRDLIGYVAELLGCYAYISREGTLMYGTFSGAPVREITGDRRTTSAVMDFNTRINGVKMVLNGFDYIRVDNTVTDGTTLVLSTNPLLQPPATEATINTVLDNVLGAIKGVNYTPFNCSYIGDPALDVGDFITLSGGYIGTPVVGLITSSTWQYHGDQQLVGAGKDPKLLVTETQSKKQENSLLETFKVETNNAIELLVRGVEGNSSQISIQQQAILLKVDAAGVISAINLSPEGIKIDAAKLDITGFVTFNDLAGEGSTTINGANITTGYIIAEVIEASTTRIKFLSIGDKLTEDGFPTRLFPSGLRWADNSFLLTDDIDGVKMLTLATTGDVLELGAKYQVLASSDDEGNPMFMHVPNPAIKIHKDYIEFLKPTSDVWTGTQAEYDALTAEKKAAIKLAAIR